MAPRFQLAFRHALLSLSVASLAVAAAGSAAWAQVPDDSLATSPASPQAADSADSGGFLGWTMSARNAAPRAIAYVQGGYDAARKGAAFESRVEARIMGPVALRLGGSYVGPNGDVRPLFAVKVDTLNQEAHGIDLAISAGYEPHGFNTVSAVGVLVAVGRRFGDLNVIGNVGYGLGLKEGERYGDGRLAGIYRVGRRLHLGLDSRFRIDLERDADEPAGEPDWELVSGPVAAVTAGRFLFSAGGGLSAIRFRANNESHVGAIGQLGVGAVF
ncbi:MAG: hypothetical protein ABUL77_02880 [Bacteroidota bacterium]